VTFIEFKRWARRNEIPNTARLMFDGVLFSREVEEADISYTPTGLDKYGDPTGLLSIEVIDDNQEGGDKDA
jgi:hypothetical protein